MVVVWIAVRIIKSNIVFVLEELYTIILVIELYRDLGFFFDIVYGIVVMKGGNKLYMFFYEEVLREGILFFKFFLFKVNSLDLDVKI